jgi:hypothetical protein
MIDRTPTEEWELAVDELAPRQGALHRQPAQLTRQVGVEHVSLSTGTPPAPTEDQRHIAQIGLAPEAAAGAIWLPRRESVRQMNRGPRVSPWP